MNNGKKLIQIRPPKDKVKKYMTKIKEALSEYHNERVQYMIKRLNMIIQGWVNYYRIGHCSKLFDKLKQWTERKVRRFQRKKQKKFGYGWKEWSSSDIYEKWGLYKDYSIRYHTVKA